MNAMKIYSYKEYKDWVKGIREQISIVALMPLFRGHALESYELLPTICRDKTKSSPIIQSYENSLLSNFKQSIKDGYIGSTLVHLPHGEATFLKDWFCLYQMRHLEIPSRLMDWSMDENIALYFAIENTKHHDSDGHVWLYPSSVMNYENLSPPEFKEKLQEAYQSFSANKERQKELDKMDPSNPDKISLLHNYYKLLDIEKQIAERRKLRQYGKFTINPNDLIQTPLDQTILGQLMRKCTIDGESKEQILKDLLAEDNITTEHILPEIPEDTQEIISEVIAQSKQQSGY